MPCVTHARLWRVPIPADLWRTPFFNEPAAPDAGPAAAATALPRRSARTTKAPARWAVEDRAAPGSTDGKLWFTEPPGDCCTPRRCASGVPARRVSGTRRESGGVL